MTYNSLLATSLIDPSLHQMIEEHPDSIQIQQLLCQVILLRILHQVSAYPDKEKSKNFIKFALELESWTDFQSEVKKIDQDLAQTLVESVKRVQFVLLNSSTSQSSNLA